MLGELRGFEAERGIRDNVARVDCEPAETMPETTIADANNIDRFGPMSSGERRSFPGWREENVSGKSKRKMEKVLPKSCISAEKRVDCNVRLYFSGPERGTGSGHERERFAHESGCRRKTKNTTTGVVL